MSYLTSARATFDNEINALQHLSDRLDGEFNRACDLMLRCTGKVVVSGMGKSGHIGRKIAATLASTGTPSFFMHPGEANHGDFGMLEVNDVLVAISNSGETAELVGLLPSVKRIGVPVIGISNNANSSLAKFSHVSLTLGVEKEACSLGLAPTTSTTATLVLGDALAIALLEAKGFTAEDFAFSHPGGALGKRLLLQVDDVMVTGTAVPTCQDTCSLKDALFEISAKGLGLTSILKNGQMIGVFTDGDLRRAFDKQLDLESTCVGDVMTAQGITIDADALAIDAINLMQTKRVSALFVVDNANRPIGALNMHMLLQAGVV